MNQNKVILNRTAANNNNNNNNNDNINKLEFKINIKKKLSNKNTFQLLIKKQTRI